MLNWHRKIEDQTETCLRACLVSVGIPPSVPPPSGLVCGVAKRESRYGLQIRSKRNDGVLSYVVIGTFSRSEMSKHTLNIAGEVGCLCSKGW